MCARLHAGSWIFLKKLANALWIRFKSNLHAWATLQYPHIHSTNVEHVMNCFYSNIMRQVTEGTGLDDSGTGSKALGSLGIPIPDHGCTIPTQIKKHLCILAKLGIPFNHHLFGLHLQLHTSCMSFSQVNMHDDGLIIVVHLQAFFILAFGSGWRLIKTVVGFLAHTFLLHLFWLYIIMFFLNNNIYKWYLGLESIWGYPQHNQIGLDWVWAPPGQLDLPHQSLRASAGLPAWHTLVPKKSYELSGLWLVLKKFKTCFEATDLS